MRSATHALPPPLPDAFAGRQIFEPCTQTAVASASTGVCRPRMLGTRILMFTLIFKRLVCYSVLLFKIVLVGRGRLVLSEKPN